MRTVQPYMPCRPRRCSDMEKVAVVILNWNGKEMMRRFLPGVLESTCGTVWVADNASSDGSMEWLETTYPAVKRIQLDQNYGFAGGYNKALAQIDAEYFVLLNSDVEVKSDWLSPLLQYMDIHPEVAACQPKLKSLADPGKFEYAGAAGGYLDALGYPYCRGRIFSVVECDEGQYDEVASVFWATGAALMVRSRVWREVGGLDARFFAHMEEIDFCWRLRSRGYGVVCVPSSVVYHLGGGTLPKENPQKTYLNFRNNLYMLYKNLPQERLRPVMRCRFWLDMLAALQFLLTGKGGSCLAVWKAHSTFRRQKPLFAASRRDNLSHAMVNPIPEQSSFSILWAYYVRGIKTYSRLSLISSGKG